MRHRVYGKHLGRDKNQRTALFRGLIRSLFLNESIITTSTKAKAIKGLVDRLISKSISNTEASRRVVLSVLPQQEVSSKLFKEIAPRYKNRTSGFTNIVKLGQRAGDGALKVRMSLVEGDREISSKGKVARIKGEEKEAVAEKVSVKEISKEEKKTKSKKGKITRG
ncbi:MAG: 50S ribosomal protein L17 [Candidatus Daviesbacteria bacterium GW2011_GWA1_41_61]|uniref:50S ribosomal protein L17 n=1 Tax=Candidatus Daviesbacteria bacterium GW2011_GWA2_40_9 TaxID=1618424 RepID=A0A0G0TZ13_9BACT|nr:MAG: 50S ribosomal protein L17 [Candidatus Daviesbacteria bacterium GW2011_GWC1_40_9]KKR82094.1 MAG: 50S ribosomal protein L17 [Candidatus Daviesbacteria bacterium GW2011_GWA2_40_9]KKR93277.1 MAG: 50S ribosomal protein L17 [Candidatus Daviesbacteria bacterium GW2011_GWB1_41_15]KKS14765.1 MAG: 50S ribosomal protein L17 [Candidatus Daviesbacteria bacterium GW2011_GWA1_41_61]